MYKDKKKITKEEKELLKRFGENIRKLREKKDMSQEALAGAAGIERSYMGTIERGERNPTLIKVSRIVKALNTTSEKLLSF